MRFLLSLCIFLFVSQLSQTKNVYMSKFLLSQNLSKLSKEFVYRFQSITITQKIKDGFLGFLSEGQEITLQLFFTNQINLELSTKLKKDQDFTGYQDEITIKIPLLELRFQLDNKDFGSIRLFKVEIILTMLSKEIIFNECTGVKTSFSAFDIPFLKDFEKDRLEDIIKGTSYVYQINEVLGSLLQNAIDNQIKNKQQFLEKIELFTKEEGVSLQKFMEQFESKNIQFNETEVMVQLEFEKNIEKESVQLIE